MIKKRVYKVWWRYLQSLLTYQKIGGWCRLPPPPPHPHGARMCNHAHRMTRGKFSQETVWRSLTGRIRDIVFIAAGSASMTRKLKVETTFELISASHLIFITIHHATNEARRGPSNQIREFIHVADYHIIN